MTATDDAHSTIRSHTWRSAVVWGLAIGVLRNYASPIKIPDPPIWAPHVSVSIAWSACNGGFSHTFCRGGGITLFIDGEPYPSSTVTSFEGPPILIGTVPSESWISPEELHQHD